MTAMSNLIYILFSFVFILYEASGRPPGNTQSSAISPPMDQFAVLRMCRRHLNPGSTNCRSIIKRWWYNSTSGICTPFVWSGCGGNDNRFESKDECEMACKGVPPCRSSRPRPAPDGCVIFKAINIYDGCPVYHWDCQDVPRTGSCPPAIDIGPLPQDCWISTIRTDAGCAKDIVTCS